MTYDAYIEAGAPEWHDLGKWNISTPFGWDSDGIRGYVFADEKNTTLVVSIKGTSMGFLGGGGPTVGRDKVNDNLLFSCCCARVDYSWTPVCGCFMSGNQCDLDCLEESITPENIYYSMALDLFTKLETEYPEANVWLVGHSLGGSISALLGQTFALPVVAFEAPGDRLAASRLHLPMPPAVDYNKLPIWHFGHTADPIYMGTCTGATSVCYYGGYAMESKCHSGRACVYDVVAEWGWRMDSRTHRITDVIEKVIKPWKDVPQCVPEEGCVDCGLWEMVGSDDS
ncbi:alpha beta-hydrolase [Thamnocephalis sphaerospora]|uniref:triacylglycerol lipase n=1 Tax=Thamnocephalis sphaerospora TaxID=78915 RepID=A0A4P9XVC4_9FUNG|nr:alpha beta-hydrolase [Thamnocephalis sphaerospora]|eukprot:RKP10225.1 alpha beta-hydrolase [Thamnocephalis sphaerospora]